MNRENKMKGGLSTLLGENKPEKASVSNEQEEVKAVAEEVIEEATPQEEEDLINSIEDEQVKEALHRKRMDKRGRPRKNAEERRKEGETYTRFCAIIRRDQIAKLHEIAFRETLTIKEIIETIVGDAISIYEQKHGVVIPQERKGDASKIFKL
jgi:hypothetical protein